MPPSRGAFAAVLIDCMVCRCGSVQRRLQPESDWNVLHLPVTNNAVGTQRWLIDPLYSFYKNCTCTPVSTTHFTKSGLLLEALACLTVLVNNEATDLSWCH